MANPFFTGQTLDDVMHDVIEAIESHGDEVNPTKGENVELTGVLLEITDPRARLSRTETRGKPFSCLGELCWYLAGTNDLDFISYYIPQYKKYAEGNILFGGYGPRLFASKERNQVTNVIDLLRRKPDSRRAVIQLFDAVDIEEEHKDVPCTCTLQFMIRRGALHTITYMRSNDVFLGLPHDVFSFTMLQEIMARDLAVELGTYRHVVGSLHLYDTARDKAQQFKNEGWQSTERPMPPMPTGDPWPAINTLLKAEAALRTENTLNVSELEDLDPYWLDLIYLLQVFQYAKNNNTEKIKELRGKMSSRVYDVFIEQRLQQAESKPKLVQPSSNELPD